MVFTMINPGLSNIHVFVEGCAFIFVLY